MGAHPPAHDSRPRGGGRAPLLRPGLADRIVKVTDFDCVRGCRQLLAQESILAGGSSGAVVAALQAAASWIEPGATCVAVLPDGGDRYLDTVYSDSWVEDRFKEFPLTDDNPVPDTTDHERSQS